MKVKGVILCGGPGKRLRPITYYFQKSMIPIGKRQKPLLEYIVRLFKYHGIEELTLLVGYKSEQIVNYFDDGDRFGLKISYVKDDENFKGTGGALMNAYDKKFIGEDDRIIIYYGDIISDLDLRDMLNYHESHDASATIALSKNFTIKVGLAELGPDGKLIGFIEKPKLDKPVSTGILVLEGRELKSLREIMVKGKEMDLMRDAIPHLISLGKPVFGYLTEAFWYDVGSAEAYEKLDFNLVEEKLSHIL